MLMVRALTCFEEFTIHFIKVQDKLMLKKQKQANLKVQAWIP